MAESHGIGKTTYNLVDIDEHDDVKEDKTEDDDKTALYAVIGSLAGVCFLLIIAVAVICCLKRNKNNNDSNVGTVSLVTREDP